MRDLEISNAFTIDDIHKIREKNYERTKDMTSAEKLEYYNRPRTNAETEIGNRRSRKRGIIATA